MAKLTRIEYPNIFKAFDDIIVDNVASSKLITKIRKRLDKGFKIKPNDANPNVAERFLSRLSVEQREIITMGDQDEAEELFGKKPGYNDANEILVEFFESL